MFQLYTQSGLLRDLPTTADVKEKKKSYNYRIMSSLTITFSTQWILMELVVSLRPSFCFKTAAVLALEPKTTKLNNCKHVSETNETTRKLSETVTAETEQASEIHERSSTELNMQFVAHVLYI